nr:hypothetical protein [Gemmatimonadota bacterium]
MVDSHDTLEALLHEDRSFPAPPEFAASARVADPGVYARADADPESFWASWAEQLHWEQRWERVCE